MPGVVVNNKPVPHATVPADSYVHSLANISKPVNICFGYILTSGNKVSVHNSTKKIKINDHSSNTLSDFASPAWSGRVGSPLSGLTIAWFQGPTRNTKSHHL